MQGRDCHAALKTEIVGQAAAAGVEFTVAKLHFGKEDFAFSLHAAPTSYTTYGLQIPDLLSYLGFRRGACPFTGKGRCYSRWIEGELTLSAFARTFEESYESLKQAERHFEACGFFLGQPEGWGYFGMRTGGRERRFGSYTSGDGHTAPHSKPMKKQEDDNFWFAFSWINGGPDKGWTTHYRPKQLPATPEVQGVFGYLGLRPFANCPEFDFEQCYWRFTAFERRGDRESNVDVAHWWFDAHPANFSPAIGHLLAVHAAGESFGMGFLPIGQTVEIRREAALQAQVVEPKRPTAKRKKAYEYDVAVSFAGTERRYAEQLATIVQDADFRVFYDNFYPAQLWGKDLVEFFDEIYRKRARYCVIFVSAEYAQRMWTNHERRSALARQLEQRGAEYILPIRVDDTELPGLPPTLGYVDLRQQSVADIVQLLIQKLR